MTQKRKRYDKQFKIAAARVVLGGEMRAVDLARELGIKGSTLRRRPAALQIASKPGRRICRQELDETQSEGRLCLAAAIDAFSRKVVGWSMSGRIAEKVAIDAIGQAVGREGPPDDGSLVFHDDQGAQRASRSFQRCLDSHGIVRSASRPGTPLDDAVAESFFKTLKRELAEERSYGTRDEADQDVFKYIELYCNRVRMHSTLGYMSPVEYERQYALGSLKESPVYPSHSKGWLHSRSKETPASPYQQYEIEVTEAYERYRMR